MTDRMNDHERTIARLAWDEGHRAGVEDASERIFWAHKSQSPPYNPGPLPPETQNPYS